MSLLRTTQSSENGVMRLTSYHRSRREQNGNVDRSGLVDLSSRSSQRAVSEMTPHSLYTSSTDGELHSIIGRTTLMDQSSSVGGESRDPTEESTPGMSRTSSSSSFSLSKAYASPQRQRYGTPPQQHRFSTPPPPRRPTPPGLRSPSKSLSFDHNHKVSLNNPMSLQSMSVGKVEVQNAPLSPSGSLSPSRPGFKRRQRPTMGTFGSLERVDPHGQPMPVEQKSEAYQRASKLLKKVDASKQAAEKVERAREAARQAMEKARKAKAAKGKTMGGSKVIRFSDEDTIHTVEEISIPRNSKSNPEFLQQNEFQPLQDDDDESTVKDRYGVDERNRYEVENAEEDALDDILDLAASQMRSQSRVAKESALPPLSPPRKAGERDDLNDMMDFAEAMLSGKSPAAINGNQVGNVNDVLDDAFNFTEELGCGSDNEMTEVKAAVMMKPNSPKRYPMPPNPAVLERVLEEKGILSTPPPSPPPEVIDSVTYRVKQRNESNDWALHDQTAQEDDASHGDELDDIMNFAVGLLGSKSTGQSTSHHEKKEKNKKKSPSKKRHESSANTDNLGQGDELDDIMDFAAGLLGSKQDTISVPTRAATPSSTVEPIQSSPAVPTRAATPSSTVEPIQSSPAVPTRVVAPSSIVEPIQSSPAVPKKEPSKPKQAESSSCFADACSVWTEEFFRAPEEEVLFDAAGNRVPTEGGAEKPSLLLAATKDKAPVPPPPEAFQLKPVATLADDLTDKSSPSFNVLDSPDTNRSTDTIEKIISKPSKKSSPIQVTTVESHSTQLIAISSDKESKPVTILDSKDEFWDSLSTIASNSKDFSMNRLHPPHDKAKPMELEALQENAPFGAILCGWLGREQQNGGLQRPNHSKAGVTIGDTYGNTFVSTEVSVVPEIPKMIEYPSLPLPIDERGQIQNELLNTVETLMTKRSSDSSDSTESFYPENGLNSFQADDPEKDADQAVERGQQMAKPISPTTSRYGDDKGDEPLGSPTYFSHDTGSSQASPKSKKVTDRRKPWNRDKSPPKSRFQPIDEDLNSRLETEDSELAAMLGIKKILSRDKDKAEEERKSHDFISGSNSQDSSLSDLLMVLTRSAGDDDIIENPSLVNARSPKSDQDEVLSPASSEVDVILSSLKRAETMGFVDDDSTELLASPQSPTRIPSPQSPTRKGVKPEDRIFASTEKHVESVEQKREEVAPTPPSPKATKEKSDISQLLQDEIQRENSAAASPTRKDEKENSAAPTPPSPKATKEKSDISQLLQDEIQRENSAAASPTQKGKKENSAAASPTKKDEKEAIVSSQLIQQNGLCSIVNVLFDDDDAFIHAGAQQLEKAQQQRDQASATKTWAEQNAAANEAAAKEAAQKKQDSSQLQQQSDDSLFKDVDITPTLGEQQLEKAQRQREAESKQKNSPVKSPMTQQSQLVAKETSCPPIFSVLMSDGESVPSGGDQQVSPTKARPQEYVSPSQSDEDELQVVQSPTDIAVRLSPVKELKLTQAVVQQLEEVSSVSSEQSAESKTKIMAELLSRYDSIIDQLIHDRSDTTNGATPKNSADVEVALKELREKREQALALSKRKKEKSRNDSESTSPDRRQQSPTRSPIRGDYSPIRSPTTSPIRADSSPTRSPNRSPTRADSSPIRSPTRSPVRAVSSPTRSPTRSPTTSPNRAVSSPTRSPTKSPIREAASSPTRSPRRSSIQQRHQLQPLISKPVSPRRPAKSVSPRRPAKATEPRQYVSPSRATQSGQYSSQSQSLYSKTSSPTPSPRRQTFSTQSRDVSPTKRPYVRQERTLAASPPRRSSSRGRSPRPEDKIEQMRRRRAESLSPPKGRSTPYTSRRDAGFRAPRDTARPVRRTYSVERPKHHSFFNDGDDQSEYGATSREIREELELAKLASESIRNSHDELFEELGVFQDKLLRHSRRKDCEREFISESRNAMNDFQHRLEQVRQDARETARSGRETPDTLDEVEHALEEAWGDFDNVRGTMLNNLRLLNEAKEELMRERLHREEDNDDEQLRMLETMIQDIRRTQQHKAENIVDSIREKRRYGGTTRTTDRRNQDRVGYIPRDRSAFSSREPPMSRRSASASRQAYNPRSPDRSSSRYTSYR